MGRPTRPLHHAGNHGTFERRSLRQAARRGRLTTRPDLPETSSGPPLLHHAEGHDPPTAVTTSVLAPELHFRGLGDSAVVHHSEWSLFGLEPADVLQELKRLALRGEIIVQSSFTTSGSISA